jgi:hypothetical protein
MAPGTACGPRVAIVVRGSRELDGRLLVLLRARGRSPSLSEALQQDEGRENTAHNPYCVLLQPSLLSLHIPAVCSLQPEADANTKHSPTPFHDSAPGDSLGGHEDTVTGSQEQKGASGWQPRTEGGGTPPWGGD